MSVMSFSFLMLWILCGVYIFQDAKKRGVSDAGSVSWGVAGFLFGLFGLIIYLVARPTFSNRTGFEVSQQLGQQIPQNGAQTQLQSYGTTAQPQDFTA